jgi:hypothetical protein
MNMNKNVFLGIIFGAFTVVVTDNRVALVP